jgi:prepilin-type N-terminal cleavage/methylation domain-containing protein
MRVRSLSLGNGEFRCGRAAFTLAELLIAMAILVLLMAMVMRIVSGTAATIKASDAQIDTASLARIVFDRFDNDFSSALLSNGTTALCYSDTAVDGNSAIAFVTDSRARGPTTSFPPWTTDTRGAIVGYRVRPVAQYVGGSSPSIPSLNRGDGRFTLSTPDIGNLATQNLWDIFGTGNARLPNDLTLIPPANDQRVLNWQIIGNTIFRLHISFVLNDGRIVQTPPTYKSFYSNGGMGTSACIPAAFSKETSNDLNQAYVKGLIIGLAILDEKTRNLAYKVDNAYWTTVGTKISRPTDDGETPVQFWSDKLKTLTSNNSTDPNYLFPPIRQNLRFYQRFYNVNL